MSERYSRRPRQTSVELADRVESAIRILRETINSSNWGTPSQEADFERFASNAVANAYRAAAILLTAEARRRRSGYDYPQSQSGYGRARDVDRYSRAGDDDDDGYQYYDYSDPSEYSYSDRSERTSRNYSRNRGRGRSRSPRRHSSRSPPPRSYRDRSQSFSSGSAERGYRDDRDSRARGQEVTLPFRPGMSSLLNYPEAGSGMTFGGITSQMRHGDSEKQDMRGLMAAAGDGVPGFNAAVVDDDDDFGESSDDMMVP